MSIGPTKAHARLRAALEAVGLDLFQHFGVGPYNERAAPDARLPDFGRGNAWGFLVGNSRALWPVFLRHRVTSSRLQEAAHPLDLYVTDAIRRCTEQVGARFELVFAHVLEPRPFPIQRLAEQIGFAQLAPSHLAAHPVLGPWFGLRAVGVLDLDAEAEPDIAGAARVERPCDSCLAPCLAAFERALAQSGPMPTPAAIAARPQPWIAIREACPVGVRFRYGPHQLAYHYTGAPSELVDDELDDALPAEPHGS